VTLEPIPTPEDTPAQTVPVDGLDDEQRAALKARYLAERDKRVRSDGFQQYKELSGILAVDDHTDPYTEVKPREPVRDHVDLLFLGGGFAGICVGVRLKQAGINDFRILESGGDFGGVWYWNRFPGAMCDTAAMVYLPMLVSLNH
jgi:cyclohexanone monooxygenase